MLRSRNSCVIQDVHVFLSSVEKKLRFLMKTFQDFFHIMDFIGNQMVQGPNENFIKLQPALVTDVILNGCMVSVLLKVSFHRCSSSH